MYTIILAVLFKYIYAFSVKSESDNFSHFCITDLLQRLRKIIMKICQGFYTGSIVLQFFVNCGGEWSCLGLSRAKEVP